MFAIDSIDATIEMPSMHHHYGGSALCQSIMFDQGSFGIGGGSSEDYEMDTELDTDSDSDTVSGTTSSIDVNITILAPVEPELNSGARERITTLQKISRNGDIVTFSHSLWPTEPGAPARIDIYGQHEWRTRLFQEVASATGLDLYPRDADEMWVRTNQTVNGSFSFSFHGGSLEKRWTAAMEAHKGMVDIDTAFARL